MGSIDAARRVGPLTATIEVARGALAPPCLNCGDPLTGAFCAACGQRKVDLAEPSWRVAREALSDATDVDGRVLRTVRALAVPGHLTIEFLRGRRVHYLGPLKLFLIAGAALSVTWALTRGVDGRYYGFADNQSARAYIDTVVRGLLAASLAIAVSGWALSRARRRVLHEAVFALHIIAAMSLWAAIVIWAGTAWKFAWGTASQVPAGVPSLIYLVFLPAWLVGLGYVAGAARRVYAVPWWAAALRALIFAALALAAVLVAILGPRTFAAWMRAIIGAG